MALTLTKLSEVTDDGVRVIHGTVTPDSSHAAGGETFDFASIGLTAVQAITFGCVGGYVVGWNGSKTAPKLMVYQVPALDGNAASAAPLAEAATADLSTLSIPFTAVGI